MASQHDDNDVPDSDVGEEKSQKSASETPRVVLGAPNNIFLMGVMGAGKSSVGWALAKMVGYAFIDSDSEVEKRARKSVAKIFTDDGESVFRDLERSVVLDMPGLRSHVISLGGGAVMDDQSWEVIQKLGVGVWLNPPPEEVARRLLADPEQMRSRPLVGDLAPENDEELRGGGKAAEKFKTLCHRLGALTGMRQSRYKQAKVTLESGFSTPEDTAKFVARALAESPDVRSYLRLKSAMSSLLRWDR